MFKNQRIGTLFPLFRRLASCTLRSEILFFKAKPPVSPIPSQDQQTQTQTQANSWYYSKEVVLHSPLNTWTQLLFPLRIKRWVNMGVICLTLKNWASMKQYHLLYENLNVEINKQDSWRVHIITKYRELILPNFVSERPMSTLSKNHWTSGRLFIALKNQQLPVI